jgi:LacI family transcriptional regulator
MPVREAAIYIQIAEKIQSQLRAGKFKVGAKLPSIRELSSTYDVNYLTARQALKHLESHGLVNIETGRGTYVALRRAQPQTIGVVVPDLTYKVNSGISRGIREESADRNVVPIFMDFHNDVQAERQCLERLQNEKFAGALVYPSLEEDTPRQLLKMIFSGFPLVFLDRAPAEMPSWLVSSDDYEIGRLAARHLAEAGCKALACPSSPAPNLRERLKGFIDEANNHGLAIPSERIPLVDGIPATESQHITEKLMQLTPRPDGIFYFNDQYALVGLRHLHDLGIDVPREVKIIGCDNIEAAWHSRPTLTTISQNPLEIGHKAFLLLSEMIEMPTEDRLRSRHLRVPVELIGRESTGR